MDLMEINWQWEVTEYEIKVTKPDFQADFDKSEKHNHLDKAFDLTMISNYFYYVCQEGLIMSHEIPHYAGLIWIKKSGLQYKPMIIQKAPLLHNEKPDFEKWREIACKLADRIGF